MEFKILGHACLLVKSKTHSIIVDPWLLGSCYWRSWWNFPGAVFDEEELAQVDALIISRVHWDHWHGPTLKRFFKGKRIVPRHHSLGNHWSSVWWLLMWGWHRAFRRLIWKKGLLKPCQKHLAKPNSHSFSFLMWTEWWQPVYFHSIRWSTPTIKPRH